MISITDELQAIYNSNMREKTPLELERENRLLRQQIDQLTNNWNELRKHIKEYLEEWENSDDEWVKGKCDMARDILYDMEEIQNGSEE